MAAVTSMRAVLRRLEWIVRVVRRAGCFAVVGPILRTVGDVALLGRQGAGSVPLELGQRVIFRLVLRAHDDQLERNMDITSRNSPSIAACETLAMMTEW
jgi:hypothetical protein